MIAPQAVAISTQSSLASLPAMLAAAEELGVPERVRDVSLPLAVALFRATGPAMNIAVAFYVAHWLGIELSAAQMIAGIAVASVTSYWRGQPAGRSCQLHHLDRADRAGDGRADRAAGPAGRGRDDPRHLPHARQCDAGRRGDRGGRARRFEVDESIDRSTAAAA